MSFRIQGVLLDFRTLILSEWICLSSSILITLFAVHIFLKQPSIPAKERKSKLVIYSAVKMATEYMGNTISNEGLIANSFAFRDTNCLSLTL